MLDIPEEVENILKRGNTRKNVRISFPNNEREDITNDNLIEESVTLTESLCNCQNLQYGLCEASMLEFQTIDVGNIKGCLIEASLEVDISSIPEPRRSELAVWKDDLDYPVYSIPYGIFRIESCKRQKDMRQRDVIAYSDDYTQTAGLSNTERLKQNITVAVNKPYVVDVEKFVLSNLKNVNVSAYEQTYKTLYSTTEVTGEAHLHYPRLDGSVQDTVTKADTKDVFMVDYEVDMDELKRYYEFMGNEATSVMPCYIHYSEWHEVNSTTGEVNDLGSAKLNPGDVIYPYLGDVNTNSKYIYYYTIYFVTTKRVYVNGKAYFFNLIKNRDSCRLINISGFDAEPITMQFGRIKKTIEKKTRYAVDETISYENIINSWLELNALFGVNGRDGKMRFITLKNLDGLVPTEDLLPANDLYPYDVDARLDGDTYFEAWYEEYVVQPIGKVVVRYKTTDGGMADYTYTFDPERKNIYYMDNNMLLQSSSWEKEDIKALIDKRFVPNIPFAGWVPAEITCVGMPHMEAGDSIEIETDEETFRTYVFQRRLTGIKGLTDEIEITGNEINTDYGEYVGSEG